MSWKDNNTLLKRLNPKTNYVFLDESGTITDLKSVKKKLNEGQSIQLRDSMFVVNAVFMRHYSINNLKRDLNTLKKKHLNDDSVILHSTEIDNKKAPYNIMSNEDFLSFTTDLTTIIQKTSFYQFAVGFNKVLFIKELMKHEEFDDGKITRIIYQALFQKIDRFLKEKKTKATLIVEQTSNKTLDKLFVTILCELKKTQKIKNINGLYFVNKSVTNFYPVGSEIVDLTAKPIYKVFQNLDFVQILPKLYNFPKGKKSSLEYIYYIPRKARQKNRFYNKIKKPVYQ